MTNFLFENPPKKEAFFHPIYTGFTFLFSIKTSVLY